MKRKFISILVILIFVISVLNTVCFAETSADYKQKSQDAKEKLEDVTGEINTALQEVQDLSSSIDSTEQDINNLNNQVKELNTSIVSKEKELSEKQQLLEERLVASYMNGQNTYIDALFSGGLANFVSNYESIKQIAEYDNNLMADVKNTKAELENEKSKVETAKKDKETKSAELKKLKSEKEAKVSSLTDEQKQIQAQMEEYDNQMKVLEQKEKAIAEAARRKAEQEKLNNSNKKNNNGGSTTPTGTFQWPVPSSHTITSNYGYRIHPISGTKKLHAGIDIGAPGGSNIVAADSGTVILSSFGYNGGYGNYIIISHGNGITTRYAHCSNLYVSVGDNIAKGQVIAAVGSTGASTGNHCHFEVRINGESKNPVNYL